MMGFKVAEGSEHAFKNNGFRKQWWDLKQIIIHIKPRVARGFRKQWWDLKCEKVQLHKNLCHVLENNDGI